MLNAERSKYLDEFERRVVKNCPICQGSGIACVCWDALNLEYRCLDAQIPLEHISLRLDDIEHPELVSAKKRVKQYIDDLDENIAKGKGLLLYGDHGTGKTSFGSMILREVMKTRPDGTQHEGYFANLEECVDLVAGGWRNKDDREEFQAKIINVKVLVLDDVGGVEIKTGKNSQLIQSTFTSLFKERSSNLRPTILTTNFSPEALEDFYGQRVYSVMMQRLDFIKFRTVKDFRQTTSDNSAAHIIQKRV